MTLLPLLACTGLGTTDTGPEAFDGTFVLTDARNYTFSSQIDIGCQEVALAEDFSIEWASLTSDMLGQPVDLVADVTSISIVAFDIPQAEVEENLVLDALSGDDLVAYATFDNDAAGTECLASQFLIPPAVEFDPAEYFTEESYTWLVTAGGGINDYAMVSFLCPVVGASSHEVHVTDDSVALSFDVALDALDPFDIVAPSTYAVDWSALTEHANGHPLDSNDLDQLMLARYDLSLGEIEADFINLEYIAAETYTISPTDVSDGIYGLTAADLADATDAAGSAFSGFAAGETWLLALRCSLCTNPAPPFLTVIEIE